MSWRAGLPILVAQAESLGALGVIRSLGRAGYPVHACSAEEGALGFSSRFASARVVCPTYPSGAFIPWLANYIVSQGIRAIVPSEAFLLAIREVYPELAPLMTCGSNARVVYSGMSKWDLFHDLLERAHTPLAAHLPPTLLVEDLSRPPSVRALRCLGTPLYVKVDAAYAKSGAPGGVHRVPHAEAAAERLRALGEGFRRALVQGHVPGRGVGAFFLLHRGEPLAEFMHRRLHEVPHTGGASSLRESWRNEAIRDDALGKLLHLEWQGVAMMEYRWDERTGAFALMEMNARFWGSLHLALYAGVDFPRLLLDAFFGRVPPPVRRYRTGLRCRLTFPGELQHLRSRLADARLSLVERASSVAEFVLLSLDPRVRSDLLFPGDPRPFARGLGLAMEKALGSLALLGAEEGSARW